jgi:uncharacterized protein (TIGR02996 family)
MPDDHAPFLAAIAAQPGEDAPRLIYADWLEEQGDTARAEAWRWYVAVKRQPRECLSYEGTWRTALHRRYEWECLSAHAPKESLKQHSWLLPQEVSRRARKHAWEVFGKGEEEDLMFQSLMDATLAAVEAMAELIREDAPKPTA